MRCGSAAVPDGALLGGKISDPNSVGRTLRALLARTEIVQTRALVAAADSVATFRVLRIPAVTALNDLDAAVAKELPFDPQQTASRWTEVAVRNGQRVVYAVAWDRTQVKNVTEAVKVAGLEPAAIELKSASLARVVPHSTCIVVDLGGSPADVVLIDDHLPQVWHGFTIDDPLSAAATTTLASALRTVLRYYRRRADAEFPSNAPVLVSSEQTIAPSALAELAHRVGQPVSPLAAPERVPGDVRHSTYLACLGLLMRRG